MFKRQLCQSSKTLPIKISEEIQQAISENVPVVALESTIITHGLPYPENIAMAKEVEGIIRKNGAVPASIGFIKGVGQVGLAEHDLELLGQPKMYNVKISRRDIPNVMARNLTGGTTIAATMILANMAGIDVFSTGGLGGVSRPWSLFDVSADLEELGKTPVAVVCSGPKSILDIPRTIEYLETKGVPVSTYIDEDMKNRLLTPELRQQILDSSNSDNARDFNIVNQFWESQKINVPGFYVRDSGVRSPFVWENPAVAANMIYNGKYRMALENGYVFCAPAPVQNALDKEVMDKIIDEALALAETRQVQGKELTPFLLQTLYERTNGRSAESNVAFVKNNVHLGSKIANELSALKGGKLSTHTPLVQNEAAAPSRPSPAEEKPVAISSSNSVVVGSVALDTMCKLNTADIKFSDSNPGKVMESSVGGVGFNVALSATSYDRDHPTVLITAINKSDSAGKLILQTFRDASMSTEGVIDLENESTAQYISMHDVNGDLAVACADMGIVEKLPKSRVRAMIDQLRPKYVLFDANISVDMMDEILAMASTAPGFKVIVEPTSGVKCAKLGECQLAVFPETPIALLTPTVDELSVLYSSMAKNGKFEDIDGWFNVLDSIGAGGRLRERLEHLSHEHPIVRRYLKAGVFQQAFQLLPFFPTLVIKDGKHGLVVVRITADAANEPRSTQSEFTLVSDEGRHGLGVVVEHYKALSVDVVQSVTGAGDSLAGCLLAELSSSESGVLTGSMLHQAQQCAVASIATTDAVNVRAIGKMQKRLPV